MFAVEVDQPRTDGADGKAQLPGRVAIPSSSANADGPGMMDDGHRGAGHRGAGERANAGAPSDSGMLALTGVGVVAVMLGVGMTVVSRRSADY